MKKKAITKNPNVNKSTPTSVSNIKLKTDAKTDLNSDFQQIQDLVKLVKQNNIDELNFEKDGYKLTIKQRTKDVVVSNIPIQHNNYITPQQPNNQALVENKNVAPEPKVENTNLITIKSPMIGTLYLRPDPHKPMFVEVGSEIKKGQTLCLVEAMKLFNEVESDIDGKIVKILIDNSKPVEFDQPLFLVEPK